MAEKRKLTEVVKRTSGTLIIIGGHEDRENDMEILREVAARVGRGKLVIATVASSSAAADLWRIYSRAFRRLGIKNLSHLKVNDRRDSLRPNHLRKVKGASGLFFTGGDQLKITSNLGGTRLCEAIHDILRNGGTVAGTSAGASVMGDTMMISGASDKSARLNLSVQMGAGLGFMSNLLIDQHFAERGRFGRLLGALACNPKLLGAGLDENTAIVVDADTRFRVIGAGAVYVVDAQGATHTNIGDGGNEQALSLFDVKVHLLSAGDRFEFKDRRPIRGEISRAA